MFATIRPTVARLSRWPRRVAALGCLLLAAASAVTPAGGRSTERPPPTIGDLLRPGEVAMSVQVASVPGELRRGDRIALLAGPDRSATGGPAGTLAERLRVLAAPARDTTGADPPSVLVATDRAAALRIAANTGPLVLVLVPKSP